MARRKAKTIAEAEAMAKIDEAKASDTPIVYSFMTKVKCPRCGSWDTVTDGTRKTVQYRKCLAPVCRHRFVVYGTPNKR